VAEVTLWAARVALVAVGLGLWFWTQRLIGQRPFPSRRIGDAVHDWTASWNRALHVHPRAADALLVASSAVIDLLGLFLLGAAILGPTFRPFVGLLLLYALRQLCQGLCAFAPPEGMIWRAPPFPSLLVMYGTATDLLFSGAVLVLRAHYTADVFAAIVTALWAAGAAQGFGPVVDRALATLVWMV
jgi:hypothetical protein